MRPGEVISVIFSFVLLVSCFFIFCHVFIISTFVKGEWPVQKLVRYKEMSKVNLFWLDSQVEG